MLRSCMTQPSAARPRLDEMRGVLDHFDDFPNSLLFPVTEYDVETGYSHWVRTYDGPNPAIAREEPAVRALLADVAPATALDAACGTGRHAAWLAEAGHKVIGVDATAAMLAVAQEKVPDGDFRLGRLEALPVEDASVDFLTCALALEHIPDLGPAFLEFARVLRPGGRAVVSDMHPAWKATGGVAAFPMPDGSRGVPFVAGYTHQMSDYIRGFLDAGFVMRGCDEPTVVEETLSIFPSFRNYPEATRQAFLGQPFVVVWDLTRAAN